MNINSPTQKQLQSQQPFFNNPINNQQQVGINARPVMNRYYSLGHSLRSFFNNQLLSDVTFMIEQKKFYAHKLILAARSPYFYNLILVNCKNTNTLEVEIQDASAEIFYNILEFVYTDTTVLKEESVWDVYQGAKFYQLTNLLALCQEFIISTLNENNVFQYWKRAQELQAVNVAEHCVLFIRNRYENMFKVGQIPISAITVSADPDVIMHTLQQIIRIDQEQSKRQPMRTENTVITTNMQEDKPDSVKNEKDAEIYDSLQNYSFPPPAPDAMQSVKKGIIKGRKGSMLKSEPSNMITTTQTFELWNSFSTPPAAFPTPESIAAYPKFFRVDQQVEDVDDSHESDEDLDEDKIRPAKKKQRQGSQILCRRLSVLKPEGSGTPSTPSESSSTAPNTTPASVGVFFQHIISCVTKLIGAERTTLFMYDKESDELCAQVSIGEAEIRIPSDKGIAGSVFTSGKAANISDVYTDSKFSSEVDRTTGYNTRCVVCAPVTIKSRDTNQQEDKIVGVIEVLNKHIGPFNATDEANLNTIAKLLSIFLMEQLENYYLAHAESQDEDEEEVIKKILLNQVLLLAPSAYRRKSRVALSNNGSTGEQGIQQPNPEILNQKRMSSFSFTRSSSLALTMPDQENFASLFDDIEDISDLLDGGSVSGAPLQMDSAQQTIDALNSYTFGTTNASANNIQQQQQQQQPQQFQLNQQQMIQLQLQQQIQNRQNIHSNSPAQQNIMNFLSSQQQPQNYQRPTISQNQRYTQIPSPQGGQQVPFGVPPSPSTGMQELSIDKKRKRGKDPEPPQFQQQLHHQQLQLQQQQQQQQQQQRFKTQPDMPFMHFRIPRYELQFIQFDGNNQGPPPQMGGFNPNTHNK